MQPQNYEAWFTSLDSLLHRYRDLWQIQPFHHQQLVWHTSHPTLAKALEELSQDELLALESDHAQLSQWLQPWIGKKEIDVINQLSTLPALPQHTLSIPKRLDTGIPGRKWQQIQAFAAILPEDNRQVLEWCAGKGHLGRLLALNGPRSVTSVEWQANLCCAGEVQAKHWQADITFIHADAFAATSSEFLPPRGQAVALHACGDLHTTLMRYWVNSDTDRLTLSPCCYHLIRHPSYQPLSTPAQLSQLHLSKQDLQLPLQETVTAGLGVQRKRQQELLWRLTFDEWQRHASGTNQYLPLPTFPKTLLSGEFSLFFRWALSIKALTPPPCFNEKQWLIRGLQRVNNVRRMELVSHFFQRPLEVWLALDRVLFLQEHGVTVQLGTFCEKPLTPRNIVIDAEK